VPEFFFRVGLTTEAASVFYLVVVIWVFQRVTIFGLNLNLGLLISVLVISLFSLVVFDDYFNRI